MSIAKLFTVAITSPKGSATLVAQPIEVVDKELTQHLPDGWTVKAQDEYFNCFAYLQVGHTAKFETQGVTAQVTGV